MTDASATGGGPARGLTPSPELLREVQALTDAATPLHELESRARTLAPLRHARGVTIYCPLYVSSICVSGCRYCGFRADPTNPIRRRRLEPREVVAEAEALCAEGVRNLLLVAGDDPGLIAGGHLRRTLEALAHLDLDLWLEIEPQEIEVYRRLVAQGVTTYVHYQETYHRPSYVQLHPRGSKASYEARLGVSPRAIAAGARRLGLGVLLGLADPVEDVAALIQHVRSLHAEHPDVRLSVNLPRLLATPPGFVIPHPVPDALFQRLMAVLACLLPTEIDLALTTREAASVRDHLLDRGITLMSAGSRTSPGAYAHTAPDVDAQFEISDQRSVAEVIELVRRHGLQPHTGPGS